MTKGNKFGTFGGVFTPSILTILGVIMYLRLPMIVGEAGLWATLGIIAIAHIISVTTGLSVSSIATDKKVEAGGTYYMISRSLGLPIGGTLGLALFVGLSFSVSLYLIGFAESFLGYWGYEVSVNSIRIAGTLILLVVTIITFISTSLAIKTQYFIMAAIFLSLLSIFFGKHEYAPQAAAIGEVAKNTIPFMVLFGIFFPAVTGFEAGVSMSGDLKDPKRSIPTGSILAIVVGFVVYIGLTVFFSSTVDASLLATDPQVLLKISWVPELVIAGIWGATLSSALGSILGAPRILQATAVDKITPRFFAKGYGPSLEPRNALILTFFIAEAGILIGELDVIARIVSIFFITTYGFLNLSCAFESWTSADFRPSFKAPVWVSFLGAAACFIVMIQLDFVAMIGALVILGGLYLYLKRKELNLQSGDTWGGVWSSLVKSGLFRLTDSQQHTRNWRPNMIMFNGADKARPFMTSLGQAICGKLGLLSSFQLVPGDKPLLAKPNTDKGDDRESQYFKHTYSCSDVYTGIDEIARVYGFAGVEPNTVLMGWTTKPENKEKFLTLVDNLQQYNLNALYLHRTGTEQKTSHPTIDIWWSGWGRNLALALNIIRHLTGADPWNRAQVRLFIIVNTEDDPDRINRTVRTIVAQYRAQVSIKVIDNHLALQPKEEIIGTESLTTDLTIVGIPDSSYDNLEKTYSFVERICNELSNVLFINASDAFETYNVITEEQQLQPTEETTWILPPVTESVYSEINADFERIDEHSLHLANALHKKVFAPALTLENGIYQKTLALANTTATVIAKSDQQQQAYQKRSGLIRSKKHFHNQVNVLLEQALRHTVSEQKDALEEGMRWYLDQLEVDNHRFPKHKTIPYKRSEFTIMPGDSPAVRWRKILKRVLHPFRKDTIPIRVSYREGAAFFLRDTRYRFLEVLVHDLEKNISASREKFRQFISWTDSTFHAVIEAIDSPGYTEALTTFRQQLKEKAEALAEHNRQLLSLYQGRLQLESRKNLDFFRVQLERIDFNEAFRKRRRKREFYQSKKEILSGFADDWATSAELELNTLRATTRVLDYYGLVHYKVKGYTTRIDQFFTIELIQPITTLANGLSEIVISKNTSEKPVPRTELITDYHQLTEILIETSDDLLQKTRQLPEEITVASPSGNTEGVSLPIRAMVAHLTETTLTGPVNDVLSKALEKIRRSVLVINDHASLVQFGLVNLNENEEDEIQKNEINHAISSITYEKDGIIKTVETLRASINKQAEELRSTLKLHNLIDLSGEFYQLVRSRRTRKLQSRVSAKITKGLEAIKTAFVSLLYSQTKGILLARKLAASPRSLTVNERLVSLITHSTPDPLIMQKLPHYYISLFSGRSSIGDNFWVHRAEEEKAFTEAYNRYRASNDGMILVLGERNSGKTAFCKRVGEHLYPEHTLYHLFAPEGGSISEDRFTEELQKVTRLNGTAHQVLGLMPHNSALVIHDLELWWEQAGENGLAIVRLLKSLLDEFSSRCLFIVNMNPFAFTTINTAEPLDTHCAGVVRCKPFHSHDLMKLIITRHKSSGLLLDFGSGPADTFGELRLARTFNRLFTYSFGNPGVAMNAWLAGIEAFNDKSIQWRMPVSPDIDVLHELPMTWLMLCYQVLIHKRMTIEKMERTLQMEQDQLVPIVGTLRRLQVLLLRGDSVYYLNPALEFQLIAHYRKLEWL